jgi:glycosyltransferase involved in cell wall biosynthesis
MGGYTNIVWSDVEMWSSTIPAWAMSQKLKAPWVASFLLFSPKPWARDPVFLRRRALFFYLSQQPLLWLVKRFANIVFVTNDLERHMFQSHRLPLERIISVKGGVDIKMADSVPAPSKTEFDAVFIGRFHWQKGVLELIDIWQHVCKSKPDARLAMIGNGELDKAVSQKVKELGLQSNIKQFGFVDGPEKFKIVKSSRVVVHPARHDNGGQAAAEAMACGLPGVSFDLPALKVYYPRGMLKVRPFDLDEFAQRVLNLLEDKELYEYMSREAREYALEWDWDRKAEHILDVMLSTLSDRAV